MEYQENNISKTQPLVSLLIANYNNSKFIVETLNSAIGQTYKNIEIIIIDDGSTDNSVSTIEDYIDIHPNFTIKLFKNKDNRGCGRIKKQCIEHSIGKYFAFLDPEDTIDLDAISKMIAIHETHSYSIVYSTHYLCNMRLEIQQISTWPGKIPEGKSHLTSNNGHISAFALCNRDAYNKTTGINPTFYVAEDQDLYLKMEEIAPVFFLNEPLYYYRKHDHNTSWNSNKVVQNYHWYYQASLCAYKRRLQGTLHYVDNYTKKEMDKYSLSYHLKLGKYALHCGHYYEAIIHYVKTIPLLYTLFA